MIFAHIAVVVPHPRTANQPRALRAPPPQVIARIDRDTDEDRAKASSKGARHRRSRARLALAARATHSAMRPRTPAYSPGFFKWGRLHNRAASLQACAMCT